MTSEQVPEQRPADVSPEHVAAVLRERIYGGIACLSTLLVLVWYDEGGTSAWGALADVAVATGGLWAASLLADVVAHLIAHGHAPRGAEATRTLRASVQILEASLVPVLLLLLAGLGVLALPGALRAGIVTSILSLALFALLAARRAHLSPGRRVVIVVALVGLGALVVVVKTFAH